MIDELDVDMIEDNITIHDKFQFEIKWAYKFHKEKKAATYNIETYFFIPQNLGINKKSYTKYDFYNDLRTYIRFKTPSILLRNIVEGSNSIINDLKIFFEILIEQPDKQKLIEYENKIKLFCCEFKSSLREHVDHIRNNAKQDDICSLLDQYIEYTEKISNAYRELRKILNVPSIDKKQFLKYLFGDEYISLTIEDYTFSLLNFLGNKGDTEIIQNYRNTLLNIIRKETKYRKDNDYPSLTEIDSDNEVLVFRKSILKKYMESILFLDVHTENDGKLMEQIAFGIAAGFSMIFATIIAFFMQKSYGNLSLPLFVALVISYMLKDRIKEILRIYFSGKLDRNLFNYKTYLRTRNQGEIGWCKEQFSFQNELDIPVEIIKLRSKDHITEIENDWLGEQIILHKKLVKLYPNNSKKSKKIGLQPVDSINDIMRFNVQKFLTKMDNPTKRIYALYEDNYKTIFAKRVYHLNLIIKYSFEDNVIFKRFRIILNRKGIKSIELISMN
jgi:hypothetical protein